MASNLTPLGKLDRGAKGLIQTLDDSAPITERLRELGFAEELTVEVLHQSPIGKDPIAVKVGEMTVAVRRADANNVMVVVE